MRSLILFRGLLTPFAHVAWTAISAGALWRVKGNHDLSFRMLLEPQFLKTFSIPVVLHMIWNSPLPSPLFIVPLVVGIVGWYVIFGLVQQGLQQIKQEQDIAKASAPELAHTQATSS
jgi:RsiW-degrading membrane proteinase PrsW (M82 family)